MVLGTSRSVAFIAAVLSLAALVNDASAAISTSPLPILSGCAGAKLIRPSSIDFCGDGNFFITGLSWSRWTPVEAAATGNAHQNTCVPFCAGAKYRVYRVAVRLLRPKKCSGGLVEYTRLTYLFLKKHPPGIAAGPLVISAPLGVGQHCP